jgi:hypothetical protein
LVLAVNYLLALKLAVNYLLALKRAVNYLLALVLAEHKSVLSPVAIPQKVVMFHLH